MSETTKFEKKAAKTDQKKSAKVSDVHNIAVQRYMRELELKARQEKKFINEAKRMRQFF